ncbi:MAG: DUF2344 domain-containing protein [Dehalococcoidia bacterium]|nr:DUF2344 domain-containing protein [Dehalococcoidia bacterium]
MERLRLRFGRGEPARFISHLDIIRFWDRTFRRAQIPLVYSHGFTPHPRIAVASPLVVGVTSEAELMDIWLNKRIFPQTLLLKVRMELPVGFMLFDAWRIDLDATSIQSVLAFAEYRVEVHSDMMDQQATVQIQQLLQAKTLPWHHLKENQMRAYDLRSLIDNIWVVDYRHSTCTLGMRLRCDASSSGRAEQVISALGFVSSPYSIHRTKLILQGDLDYPDTLLSLQHSISQQAN